MSERVCDHVPATWCHDCFAAEREARERAERKYHEAMDILTAWGNIDKAEAVARALKAEARLKAVEGALDKLVKTYKNELDEARAALHPARPEDVKP